MKRGNERFWLIVPVEFIFMRIPIVAECLWGRTSLPVPLAVAASSQQNAKLLP